MPTSGNSSASEGKAQTRDAALTWEIPPEIDEDIYSRNSAASRAAFWNASAGHIDALAAQLLEAEGVQNAKLWVPLIARLARDAAGFISPAALESSGDFDLRNAIKVKRMVVSGTRLPQAGSCAVDGVVCHKNVAHKRMRTLIQNPRVLTLSGALEPQSGAQDKLSSINALMDTESQRLRSWVEAMTAVRPDVVLVEGVAARQAQELLLEAGVSLVTGVKPALLQRVARCVGSTVRPVGTVLADEFVGRCQVFEVLQVAHEVKKSEEPAGSAEPTPVMFFKGCARGLGASIVLQGSSAEELVKVKRVTVSAAYAALWNCVEAAFLADEFAAVAGMLPGKYPKAAAAVQTAARESIAETTRMREDSGGIITSASPHCSIFGGAKEAEEEQVSSNNFASNQELWLSISCRNPAKGTQCEAPHLHSMPYYREEDLPVADFLSAAAPTNRKCPHPQCGDGAALHLRSFLHGDSLVTLSSVHLPADKELPGAEQKKVWLWLRPLGRRKDADNDTVERVALGSDAARISAAHLLTLLLDARHLSLLGSSLRHDFVRYLGLGRTVICLHHSVIRPYAVRLPPASLHVAHEETTRWLTEEIMALTEEADEIFDCLEKTIGYYVTGPEAEVAAGCSSTLSEMRATFMSTLRSVAATDSVKSVHLINKLRQHLAMLVQQWDSAFNQQSSNNPPAAALHLSDAKLAPSGGLSTHSRASSSASLAQAAQLSDVDESNSSTVSTVQYYMAPKLMEASPSQPSSKDLGQEKSIPTGLVARYISHFEEQEQLALERGNNIEVDTSSSARRHFGPSTTIDLRDTSIDLELWRTITSDDELDDGFESKLERLSESLSLLVFPSQGSAGEERESRPSQAPPAVPLQVFLSGRSMLPDATDASRPPITIYDKEPTSVVAFFLSTKEYQKYEEDAKANCLHTVESAPEENIPPHAPLHGPSTAEAVLQASVQLDCQMIAEDKASPSRARFHMTAYYAPHFAALRQLCVSGGEGEFLASVGRCVPWAAQGGKSNVFFAKTRDDRYIIKQLTKPEKQSVLEYAPDYFKYLSGLTLGNQSSLAKIVGIYQVQVEYPNGQPPPVGKDGVIDFIIMENLFHGCEIQAIYDLKGSERDRYAAQLGKGDGPPVLLDDNLRELNRNSPTLVAPAAYKTLQQSLCNDTSFLAALGVMDYSLLVGVRKHAHELVVGLVDYVRQYTWDKQVESWVKKSGLLGGAGKEPTIISPQQYARRFRNAMLSYFTVVPCLGKPPSNLCASEMIPV